MYGEKEEEVTELRMDLMDVKQMYKQQVWYITYTTKRSLVSAGEKFWIFAPSNDQYQMNC